MMSIPSQSAPLKEVGTAVGRHLYSTICKTEPGVLVNANNRGGNREMITVSIRIQAKHETHYVKVRNICFYCSVSSEILLTIKTKNLQYICIQILNVTSNHL